jgi:hypothetical protein
MKNKLFKDIFKKGDIIIAIVLVVAVVLTAVFATRTEDCFVEIFVDGNIVFQLDINTDTIIDLKNTDYNVAVVVEIKDGKVMVTDSDCPDKLCVHSSAVSSAGGMIICLPNRVVVKVSPKEVDAIS